MPGFEKTTIGAMAASGKYLWLASEEIGSGSAKGPVARRDRLRGRAMPLLRYRQGRMELGSAEAPRRADGRGLEARPNP